MKIETIELCNFGSYEDVNTFDIKCGSSNKRIVIVGGKNGAGKTTLFTAIQVCLYGHASFGYKASGKLYLKEIYNLINSNARMDEEQSAYVRVVFSETRIDVDNYEIKRSWTWNNKQAFESVEIYKNGEILNEEESVDFQNYLLHLIPPELLNLYFFDGERIADYFLGEQHNNIKDALLILSGNDTYEILYNSVRRLLIGTESDSHSTAQDYADQKEALKKYIDEEEKLREAISDLTADLEQNEADLKKENDNYSSRGGISLDEWKSLQKQLHDEEDFRERTNIDLKSIATDILPFIIVHPLLTQVHDQIELEREQQTYHFLQKKLSSQSFKRVISDALKTESDSENDEISDAILKAIRSYFKSTKLENGKNILMLSEDEISAVISLFTRIDAYDPATIAQKYSAIKESIQRSKNIRDALQKSSIENYEDHVKLIAKITSYRDSINYQLENTNNQLAETHKKIEIAQKVFEATKKALENEIKKKSVSELSDRMMLLVEELQEKQYRKLLFAVEKDLNSKFQQLIRKENFVDHIYLDSAFSLHLIRSQNVEINTIRTTMDKYGVDGLRHLLKERAFSALLSELHTDESRLSDELQSYKNAFISLPIELDHNRFSNGEKQILVMALYWALMRQSKNELPFVIDTPFARIDTEHRANITKLLFKELDGQLFVLSTNEELRHEHLQALDDQIAKVFMLDYQEDKRTRIIEGNYFEV